MNVMSTVHFLIIQLYRSHHWLKGFILPKNSNWLSLSYVRSSDPMSVNLQNEKYTTLHDFHVPQVIYTVCVFSPRGIAACIKAYLDFTCFYQNYFCLFHSWHFQQK